MTKTRRKDGTMIPMAEEKQDELLPVSEVAKALNVTSATVRNWIKDGEIDYVQLPKGRYKIRRSMLDILLKSRQEGTGDVSHE